MQLIPRQAGRDISTGTETSVDVDSSSTVASHLRLIDKTTRLVIQTNVFGGWVIKSFPRDSEVATHVCDLNSDIDILPEHGSRSRPHVAAQVLHCRGPWLANSAAQREQ